MPAPTAPTKQLLGIIVLGFLREMTLLESGALSSCSQEVMLAFFLAPGPCFCGLPLYAPVVLAPIHCQTSVAWVGEGLDSVLGTLTVTGSHPARSPESPTCTQRVQGPWAVGKCSLGDSLCFKHAQTRWSCWHAPCTSVKPELPKATLGGGGNPCLTQEDPVRSYLTAISFPQAPCHWGVVWMVGGESQFRGEACPAEMHLLPAPGNGELWGAW